MKIIGEFFGKFRNKASKHIQNYLLIIETIKKYTKVEIEAKDIEISSGTLKIRSSQALKNEIFIKKTQILKEINQKTQNLTISDIS